MPVNAAVITQFKGAVSSLPALRTSIEADEEYVSECQRFVSAMEAHAYELLNECGAPAYSFSASIDVLLWLIPEPPPTTLKLPENYNNPTDYRLGLVLDTAHHIADLHDGHIVQVPKYRITPVLGMKEFVGIKADDIQYAWSPAEVHAIINGENVLEM